MTSHIEYIAEQDEAQLTHLIEVARQRLDNLKNGGWTWIWVVAANANCGWFADDDYASAVEFLAELGRKASSTPHRPELSLERHQYRPHEAERLIAGTKAQSSAAA
jgi:hypothetical protein